jgi:hypothetical protein
MRSRFKVLSKPSAGPWGRGALPPHWVGDQRVDEPVTFLAVMVVAASAAPSDVISANVDDFVASHGVKLIGD